MSGLEQLVGNGGAPGGWAGGEQAALARLHGRLESRARDEGLLDVAYRTLVTPVGELLLAATPLGLVRVAYHRQGHEEALAELAAAVSPRVLRAPRALDEVARQLEEYFAGRRRRFELPVDLRLARGFRQEVLTNLPAVAYGTTVGYGELAARLGHARAARAVGTACATNPVPIVVPCHRVVRSDGSSGRYAGGEAAKLALLALEHAARG